MLKTAIEKRKGLYGKLKVDLDAILIDHFLTGSYRNFKADEKEYPFVDIARLKPKAATSNEPERDMALHNTALVFLYEGIFPERYKDMIRCWSSNRIVHDRLKQEGKVLEENNFVNCFGQGCITYGNNEFEETVKRLSRIDFGLLIQHVKRGNRYAATHYRVKVEQSTIGAARELAKKLRYTRSTRSLSTKNGGMSRDTVLQMMCECYGFNSIISGRREAAMTAAEVMKKQKRNDFRIYAGSSESRTLTRITRDSVSKYILLQLNPNIMENIRKENPGFKNKFLIDNDMCIYRVRYIPSEYAVPTASLREFSSKVNWLNVDAEHLVPKKEFYREAPIPFKILYGRKNPLVEKVDVATEI